MPKIKNISGADRTVPGLGYAFVLAGQVVEVPADQVEGYVCQTEIWAEHRPAPAAKKTAAKKAAAPKPADAASNKE